MSGRQIGVWIWGTATVVLALLSLSLVIVAGFYLDQSNDKYVFRPSSPSHLAGLFYAVKENGGLIAGILGFSGLAWSYFFTAS